MVTLYDDVSDAAIVFGQFSGKRAKIDAVVSRALWYNGRRKVTGGGDMKPQFANVFNVSVNDNRSECFAELLPYVCAAQLHAPAKGTDRYAGKDGR